MAHFRVLIVDDHRETARMMQAGINTLEQEFEIIEAPSGEEAVLELSNKKIDLLIADLLLPGISGLDVMEKFKDKFPDLKTILVSGVTDTELRKKVAHAGADAFFFKPIDMADFLDTVERVLGIVETTLPLELHLEREAADEDEDEPLGMAERITGLRKSLGAISVYLLGNQGQVLVRSGNLPNAELETSLMPSLMTTFISGVKVSHSLGSNDPDHLLSFYGEEYDLFLSPVGEAYCLMIATPPQNNGQEIGNISEQVRITSKKVLKNLADMGVLVRTRDIQPRSKKGKPKTAPLSKEAIEKSDTGPIPVEKGLEPSQEEVIVDPAFAELFSDEKVVEPAKPRDADAFWDVATQEEVVTELPAGDTLSFKQAKKLGLAPPENDG